MFHCPVVMADPKLKIIKLTNVFEAVAILVIIKEHERAHFSWV